MSMCRFGALVYATVGECGGGQPGLNLNAHCSCVCRSQEYQSPEYCKGLNNYRHHHFEVDLRYLML